MQSSSQIVTTNKPTPSFFTGWMSFLSPNQQCQSTEGKTIHNEYTQENPRTNRQDTQITFYEPAYWDRPCNSTPLLHTRKQYSPPGVPLGVFPLFHPCLWPLKASGYLAGRVVRCLISPITPGPPFSPAWCRWSLYDQLSHPQRPSCYRVGPSSPTFVVVWWRHHPDNQTGYRRRSCLCRCRQSTLEQSTIWHYIRTNFACVL